MANVRVKRSRLAKNKKKAWRKVDISEVEEFLEDERLQERTGGLVAERPDDQLFVVDKSSLPLEVEEPSQKKRRREAKPLRCHASLVLDPRIKPAKISYNKRDESLNRRHKNVIEKTQSGILSKTEEDAAKQRKLAKKNRQQRITNICSMPKATYDLWEDEKQNTDEKITPRLKKNTSCNAPSLSQKPYQIAAVEVPHPGASYNPTYQDYQNLLQKAHAVEVKKAREERKTHSALEAKFPTLSKSQLEKNWLQEMSAGLHDDGEPEIKIEPDTLDKLSVNPPVRREDKKTKTQRNKEKQKKLQEKMKQKDSSKTNETDIFRLKKIKADIKAREGRLERRAALKHEEWQRKATETRKLGRNKYEEPDLEIKLSDELEGSLRKLKPEGNLLMDRFKSLQKRNVIEPRNQARKYRKYKKKLVEKRGHRNITL